MSDLGQATKSRLEAVRADVLDELHAQRVFLQETLAQLVNGIADFGEHLTERVEQAIAQTADGTRKHMLGLGERLSGQIVAEAADLRQIGNLGLRRIGRTTPRIRCVFLVHAMESWDAQIDIYEAMRRDSRFEPLVVTINRRFPGDDAFRGEDVTSAALDEAGVPHLRLGMEPAWAGLDILRALNPDVIFRQSQWEADVPPAFATERIGFARICSVPYGMSIVGQFAPGEVTVGGVSPWSFDQPYHRLAWRIFCETEQTRSYFTSFQHADPAKFVVSGYPKLTRLLRACAEPDAWPVGDPTGRRFRVIWAPHHSVGTDWLGFGVFDRIHGDFLAWAETRPDIDFVLKPHPALFKAAVRNGAMRQDTMTAFLEAWQALPNCTIELGSYAHLFAASDMMVTDGLSFLTEYPVFEKPLVFFDSGRHVRMNALGDMALACAHPVTTFAAMRGAIEHYAAGGEWALEQERKALLKVLFPTRVEPVAAILDAIADGFVHQGETL